MSTLSVCLFLVAEVFASAFVTNQPTELNQRLVLTLEQKRGDVIQVRDPTHVFGQGDLIRFRLRSSVNGFLYVIDQGSSGKYQQLFPRDRLTRSREIAAGEDYRIPASGTGWFLIKDPPGYETVYFLIAPADLGASFGDMVVPPSPASPDSQSGPTPDAFSSATPRCNDELLRARGDCMDSAAGPKPIQKGDALPEKLRGVPAATARDLIVVTGSKDTYISSTGAFAEPIIYQFKIAHK